MGRTIHVMSKNTDFGKIAIQQKKVYKGPYLENLRWHPT